MFSLIKLYITIYKNRIKKIPRKVVISISSLAFIVYLCLTIFNYNILKHIITESKFLLINKYVIFIIIYLSISIFPLYVYKNFFEKYKLEILFIAPIKLEVSYAWFYFSKLIAILFVYIIVFLPFIPILNIININILYYLIYNIDIIILIYSLTNVIVLLIHTFFKKNTYKAIIFFIGLFEVIMFLNTYLFINKKNLLLNNFLEYINYKILNCTYLDLIFMIFIFILIYYVSFMGYKFLYYYIGFNVNHNLYKNKNKKKKFKYNFYFFYKDKKLLIRSLEKIKFLIVTFIIYFITTIYNSNTPKISSVLIIIFIFCFTFSAQVATDSLSYENNKLELYILNNLAIKELYYQKLIYNFIITGICIMVYSLMLFAKSFSDFNIIYVLVIIDYCFILIPIVSYKILRIKLVLWNGVILKDLLYHLFTVIILLVILLLPVLVLNVIDIMIQSKVIMLSIYTVLVNGILYIRIRLNLDKNIRLEEVDG